MGDLLRPERFRAGDVVRHGPTGEEWVVAWCRGSEMSWCGWPEGCARTADCTLVTAVDDREHMTWLAKIADSGGRRASMARYEMNAIANGERDRPAPEDRGDG